MEEYQAPVTAPAPVKKAFFSKKNLPLLIALAAAVVLVAVLAVVLIVSSGPKAVAERFVARTMNGDIAGACKLYPVDYKEYMFDSFDGGEEDFYELMSDRYDEDIVSWKDFCRVLAAAAKEYYEDEFGDEYRITVAASKVKPLSARKLRSEVGEVVIELFEDYGLNADRISKGAEVTVKAKISGDGETEKYVFTVYLARIGLSWKVLSFRDDMI